MLQLPTAIINVWFVALAVMWCVVDRVFVDLCADEENQKANLPISVCLSDDDSLDVNVDDKCMDDCVAFALITIAKITQNMK